jgi:poly(A) polymerase/tRNA nucleotidyltransferase (CCA-adding enzyme)
VRDALAGLPVADMDVAAPFPPEDIMARLLAAGCKVFETGITHGTVTAVWEHQPIEVTALRRDVLTDGRHAEVAWTTDWREDAARRDFTINAMSLGADGVLHDYFGGRDDLARGLVRFVGDPETRLAEDHLRLLRFFRFHARYGRGAPDAAALQAIHSAIPGLARLSVERIWMEIKRILMVAEPVPALRLMAELGVLPAILPEFAEPDVDCLARLVVFGAPAEPLLRLAALGGATPGLAARLKLSSAEARALRFLNEAEMPSAEIDAAEFRRWRARHDAVTLDVQEAALWLADARDGAVPMRAALRATLHAEAAPVFPLQGRDLLAEGAPPGPALGALLARVEAFWIAGGCVADHAACLSEAKRLMVR